MATDTRSSTPSGGALSLAATDELWLLRRGFRDLAPVFPHGSLSGAARELPDPVIADLARRGLRARSRRPDDDSAIEGAETVIRTVGSLLEVVLRVVQGLFILEVPDPAYDQSHSEPAYPGYVFVSLPPHGSSASLRLAEAIIHEAMHLSLGRVEEANPLVMGQGVLFSPWKHENRPASGVLHGAYVFACLRRFYHLALPFLDESTAAQAIRRSDEIRHEALTIDWAFLERQLTPCGVELLAAARLACDAR